MHLHDIVVKGYEDVTNTFDVIIIAVKTHQLDAVIPHLTHLAHEDTLIILAQNGYGKLEHISFKNVCTSSCLYKWSKERRCCYALREIINYVYKIMH